MESWLGTELARMQWNLLADVERGMETRREVMRRRRRRLKGRQHADEEVSSDG
jgi:hypothetical protein